MSKALTGLVLAGGYSRRMGTDKSMLKYKGKTWLETQVRQLEGIMEKVYISCRPDQVDSYKTFGQCLPDLDTIGPFGGIRQGLKFLNADILVVTNDQILLQQADLMELVKAYQGDDNTSFDGVFYSDNSSIKVQPFPGIYCLRSLRLFDENIQLKNFRMLDIISSMDKLILAHKNPARIANWNKESDIKLQ